MPTYLFCVLTPASELGGAMPHGFERRVRALDAGPLVAWVETIAHGPVATTLENVRVHDAVTDAAMATGVTPVPARFGQHFQSDDACRDALRSRAPRLLADLARVDGLVEMRVIAKLAVGPPAVGERVPDAVERLSHGTEGRGRAYLNSLRRRRIVERNLQALSVAVRQRLTETVGAFVRGEAISLDPVPAAVLNTAHLVPRDAVTQYRSALLDATLGPEVERIVVSGPGAPYRFVSDPNG